MFARCAPRGRGRPVGVALLCGYGLGVNVTEHLAHDKALMRRSAKAATPAVGRVRRRRCLQRRVGMAQAAPRATDRGARRPAGSRGSRLRACTGTSRCQVGLRAEQPPHHDLLQPNAVSLSLGPSVKLCAWSMPGTEGGISIGYQPTRDPSADLRADWQRSSRRRRWCVQYVY
jgi:hypothetical protein